MLIDFLLLPMNVWNHKEIWAVIFGECYFRLCVYNVHWSEFCGGTCIWCGIHIHDIRCQKLGLVWRGNQTFKQYIYIYICMYVNVYVYFGWRFFNLESVVVSLCWIKFFLIIKKKKKLCVFTYVWLLSKLLSNRSVVRNFVCIITWEKLLWGK